MSDNPKLIVMMGLPGTGKSAVAYALAKELKIPVFSVDPIHSSILKSGLKDTFEVGYSSYLVSEALAKENLSNNLSVVIDASNYVKEAHQMWENLAKSLNVKLYVIEFKLNPNEHKKRIESRVRNIYGMKEVTWSDIQKRKSEMVSWEIDKLIIDTSIPVRENVDLIIKSFEM